MPSIFFYISGHGFGHSVRQIEIINALLAIAPEELRVVIRTSAAAWLFTRSTSDAIARAPALSPSRSHHMNSHTPGPASITLLPGEVDTGVVQIDSLRLDERATIELASAFYDELPRRVALERALLDQHGAQLVIADVPPLACAAADAAGIPSVVCGNFTWDWIYDAYRSASPLAGAVIDRIRELYAKAESAWRLPMHGGFESVGVISDVPLVARHASTGRRREDIRAQLRLPHDARLALVSFGGYGVRDLPLDSLDCTDDWHIVLTTRDNEEVDLPRGVLAITEQLIYECGFRYQDIVRAVDVVISKPGYGIISDCVANNAALLYTSRGRFAEYDVLVQEMPTFLQCQFIAMEDFLAGRWGQGLDALAALPAPALKPRTDGAEVVARRILDCVKL